MCGRIYITTSLERMLSYFGFNDIDGVPDVEAQLPRWNGAPGQMYPIIINAASENSEVLGRRAVNAKWGFVPPWSKDGKGDGRPPPIIARSETVATNGMFRQSYKSKRCLVPISGFFEWKDIYGTGKNKQPYAIGMADDLPFCLAGIWSTWRDKVTGLDLRSFAVLTCEPNALMAQIHDRMPVILHRKDYDRWLGIEPDPHDLLVPYPDHLMKMWKIGSKVGKPANNTPDIIDPIDDDNDGGDGPPAPSGPEQPTLF